jgi:hypothetical protein
LTGHIFALIIYSGGTTGISHLKKKNHLADTLFENLERGELEVVWSGIKE